MSLDLTNNKLLKMDSLLANGWLWLRELKLTGNKLKGWPRGLEGLPALLTLDLSFNEGLDLKGADLTPLMSLWRLALAGCGFCNLTGEEEEEEEDEDEEEAMADVDGATAHGNIPVTPLAACASLTDLDLSENEFTSIRALLPLTQVPQLRALDLQGNEDLPFYKKKVVKFLPKLAKIDGDGTGMGTGEKYRGVMCYEGSGTGTVFGSNVDKSSCSCVEGNPCAFPDSCEDWKNRYTIALQVRKNKGYDPGVRGVHYNL